MPAPSSASPVPGPGTCWPLAKGCTLDLHPRVFGLGHVVQSTLARVDVILVQVSGDGDLAFDIHVGRSFAEYLWLWLEDASVLPQTDDSIRLG